MDSSYKNIEPENRDNPAPDKLFDDKSFIKNLLDNLSGFVYRCKNDEHWTMLNIEGEFKLLTGYRKEEIINNKLKSFSSLIHTDDRKYVWQNIQQALTEQARFTIEYRIIQRDGSVKWVWERGTGVFKDGKVDTIDGVIEDITEQKQAENELQNISENLRITLNSIGDAVVATDINGHVTRMNPMAEKLTGWTLSEARNKPLHEVFIIENSQTGEQVENPVRKVLKTGRIVGLANHTKLISKTGEEHQIADSGSPITGFDENIVGVVLVFRDVTKTYEQERKLRIKSYGVDNAQLGIYEINEEGGINYANLEACRMLGYRPEELIGMSLFMVDTSFDAESFKEHRKAVKKQESKSIRTSHKRKDGTFIPVEVTISYFEYEGKQYSYSFVKDISEHLAHEKSLKEREERFRTLAESVPAGIIVADKEQNIHYINSYFVKLFGYEKEEIPDVYTWMPKAFPDKEKRQAVIKKWGMALEKARSTNTEMEPLEEEVSCKNGKKRHIEFRIKSGDLLDFILFTDISSRKKTENRLKKSEQNYKYLFENNPHPMWIYDLESLRFLAVNETAIQKYGYSRNEFMSMTIKDIRPEEEKDLLLQNIQNQKDSIQASGPWKHLLNSGETIIVEIFSHHILFADKKARLVIAHDITEKEKALDHLKLLERSVNQSPVEILITDNNGAIEYVNPAFCQLTGYSSGEVLGKTPKILNSGHQNKIFYQKMWNTILSGKDWKGEIRNKKKDGSMFWEDMVISPILNEEGIISHFVSIREDITNKKKMIDDLVEAKKKAEESDRLKSAFLANMSHEIRTPMNGILGFMDVLQNDDITEEQRDHYMSIVRKGGNRLLNTINDIIEISKIEAGHNALNESSIFVPDMLNYFHDFYHKEALRKKIDFRIQNRAGKKANVIVSDKTKLESIIGNFIKNAFKFTADGYIELGVVAEPGKIVFYVADTGTGIPGNRQKAIFERFVQADLEITRPHEGSGLGLSIAQGYAAMLGGKIWVESTEGKGSTFYFSMPFKTATNFEQEKHQENPDRSVTPQGKEQLLLIAEDEEHSFMYLKIILTNNNYRVLWARNGAEAVKYCQENHNIAMVLMDVKMPVTDGLEATRQIRQFNPELPIIAQTAYALSGDRLKALRAGCNDYIDKPIKKERLLTMIEKHLNKS